MKGGTVFSDGRTFYAQPHADNYSVLEAHMLNFLYHSSPTARRFLDNIVKKPNTLFDSNVLYTNHDVLQVIFEELNHDQKSTFIELLQQIVDYRLHTRHAVLDRGHANQVIIMNNVLILFGYNRIDPALLTHATIQQSTIRAITDAAQESNIRNVTRNVTRNLTRRRMARDAAMEGLRRNRIRSMARVPRVARAIARDAAMEGLRRDVLRGIRRTRDARITGVARDVARDAAREGVRQNVLRSTRESQPKKRKRTD